MSRWVSKPPLGTPIDFSHPLAKGLVGAWLFNEGTGLRANDGSGYGNNGTLTNMANPPTAVSGWAASMHGSCLSFDGVDDYVSLPNTLLVIGAYGTQTTVTMWIKQNGIPDSRDNIFCFNQTGVNNANTFVLEYYSGTERLYINGGQETNTTWSAPNGVWAHIAVVHASDNKAYIYIDGRLRATSVTYTSNPSATNGSLIAKFYGGRYRKMSIDDVRIYNRALQSSEIAQLYSDPYCIYQQPRNVKYFFGGGQYFKTLSENLVMQTQYQRSFGKQLTENLGFADITPRDANKSFTDILLAIDGTIKSISRLLDEDASFIDVSKHDTQKTFLDGLAEIDVFGKYVSRTVEEMLNLLDNLSKGTSIARTETVNLSVALIKFTGIIKSEDLSIEDARQIAIHRVFTELLECLDAYSKAIAIAKQENLDLTDTIIIIMFLELAKLLARETLSDLLKSKDIHTDSLESKEILTDSLEAKL